LQHIWLSSIASTSYSSSPSTRVVGGGGDGIRNCGGQLDHGEDGVKAAEVVREFEVVCAMADTSIDDKGAQTSVREFRRL
jgi:hypothetical protein